MNRYAFVFAIAVTLCMALSCSKNEAPKEKPTTATAPQVTTSSLSDITVNSAKCGGVVSSDGGATVSSRGVCWSTSENPTTTSFKTTDGNGTGTFVSNITGLTPGTTYYVRAYAINSAGTAYGNQQTLVTGANLAVVTTRPVSEITTGTATAGGEITSDGGGAITARGVCWSANQNPTISDTKSNDGTGAGTFSSTIWGMNPNTTYYYRAYATNQAGTSYGNSVALTTKGAEILGSSEMLFPNMAGSTTTTFLDGEQVTVELINGLHIYQGDMILTPAQQSSLIFTKGAALESAVRRWPQNTVYYSINATLPDQSRVIQAMNAIADVTNIIFTPRTGESNYIEFVFDKDGCSSYVGMVGGRQEIRIANWGTMGNVMHEICHALGMLHEHSKTGRDAFITIHTDNIIDRYKHNFNEYKRSVNSPTPQAFDFNSIMLYSPNSFSKNNNPTITKKDGSTFQVQRLYLSTNDTELLNTLYPSINETVKDADNNLYSVVRIGSQRWMGQNLKTTRLNDGSFITNITANSQWSSATTAAWCSYENENTNRDLYGLLYNWSAINSGKLCPVGWRVPTDEDWQALNDYLGGTNVAGGALKERGTDTWASPNTGANNSSGFSARPGGYRYSAGYFGGKTYGADWWSSTTETTTNAWAWGVNSTQTKFNRYSQNKLSGLSVRCVR